jgi:hypothetical protein
VWQYPCKIIILCIILAKAVFPYITEDLCR